MIVLDTNVISEVMRERPHPGVVAWMVASARSDLCATAVTVAEITAGLAVMPSGRRQRTMMEGARRIFEIEFTGRILPFDHAAALAYADIIAARRRVGAPIGEFDAQIAAIALSRGMAVATRDRGGFEGTGVAVVDPWAAP